MPTTVVDKSLDSDRDLIESALAGNQRGYERLMQRYQHRLFGSIRSDVGCPFLAEDIVQDAFVRAFVHLGSFKHQSNFYSWLYRIALNTRWNHLRKHKRVLPLESVDSSSDTQTKSHESPPSQLERAEARDEVRRALDRLPEHHKAVLILREFEGCDYAAIAKILSVNLGTVRSRLARARANLRQELSGYDKGIGLNRFSHLS